MKKEVVSTKSKVSADALPNGASGAVAAQSLVALAKIGRPYGLTGALRVFPYSSDAAVLRRAKAVVVRGKSYGVESMRTHGDALVAVLEGIATPELAQTLTNAEVFVTRDAFPPLPEGEYYWVDLVGLDCVNGARSFGTIIEVFEAGAHPILRVRHSENSTSEREELIPFVDAIVRSVDLKTRRVDVDWEGSE
jgi:16S rRNA processing protein RimM